MSIPTSEYVGVEFVVAFESKEVIQIQLSRDFFFKYRLAQCCIVRYLFDLEPKESNLPIHHGWL